MYLVKNILYYEIFLRSVHTIDKRTHVYLNSDCLVLCFKDTHRGKAPSNKTPALTKSRNMGISVVGTSN